MAIQKSKTLPNGAIGDYWRILDISINRPSLQVVVSIALYTDAAHAAAGAPHLGLVKPFSFVLLSTDLTTTNIVSMLYTKIRTQAATTVNYILSSDRTTAASRLFDDDIANGTMV